MYDEIFRFASLYMIVSKRLWASMAVKSPCFYLRQSKR